MPLVVIETCFGCNARSAGFDPEQGGTDPKRRTARKQQLHYVCGIPENVGLNHHQHTGLARANRTLTLAGHKHASGDPPGAKSRNGAGRRSHPNVFIPTNGWAKYSQAAMSHSLSRVDWKDRRELAGDQHKTDFRTNCYLSAIATRQSGRAS